MAETRKEVQKKTVIYNHFKYSIFKDSVFKGAKNLMSKGELIRSGQQRNIHLCQKGWFCLSTLAVFAQSHHLAGP